MRQQSYDMVMEQAKYVTQQAKYVTQMFKDTQSTVKAMQIQVEVRLIIYFRSIEQNIKFFVFIPKKGYPRRYG